MSLHTWHCQDPHNPSSCATLMLNPHWGRAATDKKKVFHLCTQGCFDRVQLFVTLQTVACQASLSGGFSRQEHWSILANTDCHTLLEHYISCCPRRSHIFYCCYKPLSLYWAFAVLWSSLRFFSPSFFNFNF